MRTLLIVLLSIVASGCALNSQLRAMSSHVTRWTRPLIELPCTTRLVPIQWADGHESMMKMKICGYGWKVAKNFDTRE